VCDLVDCRSCKLHTVRKRDGSYRVFCVLRKRQDLGDLSKPLPIRGDPSFCSEDDSLPFAQVKEA